MQSKRKAEEDLIGEFERNLVDARAICDNIASQSRAYEPIKTF